jgi:hypothetical protein
MSVPVVPVRCCMLSVAIERDLGEAPSVRHGARAEVLLQTTAIRVSMVWEGLSDYRKDRTQNVGGVFTQMTQASVAPGFLHR